MINSQFHLANERAAFESRVVLEVPVPQVGGVAVDEHEHGDDADMTDAFVVEEDQIGGGESVSEVEGDDMSVDGADLDAGAALDIPFADGGAVAVSENEEPEQEEADGDENAGLAGEVVDSDEEDGEVVGDNANAGHEESSDETESDSSDDDDGNMDVWGGAPGGFAAAAGGVGDAGDGLEEYEDEEEVVEEGYVPAAGSVQL
ncbi:hypothetical protein HDU98_007276 [Podochytrium sp. JEL0797]|nr:hypothetical protein HDU98_007274 [Podochytrium sp. JEL0797]KAJ3069675.1 hypothetical protein HDU98_007276 [Podochytrium sp. JEL0797]